MSCSFAICSTTFLADRAGRFQWHNGEKALEILRARKVDVVLADIKMPEMDGVSLTSRLRETHPGLPVVLMTGFPSVETAVAALRVKAEDYIIKPFNINQLYKLIDAKVRESRD